jgi:hypothetical protein
LSRENICILNGYLDNNWVRDSWEMKYNIGDIFKLRSSPIMQGTMKRLCTTMSFTKAEYMTFTSGTKESCVAKEGFIKVRILDGNEPT